MLALTAGWNSPLWAGNRGAKFVGSTARRFAAGAIHRIAARGGARLGEVGRVLENTVSLAKTETRPSRAGTCFEAIFWAR